MPSIKEPDLALAGLALLVIFGLLIWYDRPVESARPFDPYIQHQEDLQATGYAYESWLWQDPFGFDLDSYTERNQYYIDFGDNLEKASPRRYRIHKKIDVEPVDQRKEFEDKKEETESKKGGLEGGHCEYQLNNIEEKSLIAGDYRSDSRMPGVIENPIKILAPLLKVRPNTTENKELRTRDRYAVIAGLIESGYRPSETDRLHFCSSQKNKEYDVRWEHFRYKPQPNTDTFSKNETHQPEKDETNNKSDNKSEKKPDIVVMWMNSEIFTDDAKFGRMSGSLFKSEGISEINFSIYDLNNILDQKRSAWITEKINRINDENCKNQGIELEGIQTDDEALIKKLTRELRELRNIKEPSEVMIIAEQDSENVRNLANNFCKSLSSSFSKDEQDTNGKNKPNANAEDSPCEIRNVSYLKGLDAYQQILPKKDKNEEANKPAARLSAIDLDTPPPPSIGPSQFDYLHRLAEQIKDTHREINLKKRDSGVKAVGIFGSDFYDKLLILEALRAEMPNILVFTTDLDAQMLHPPHWLSTRNLIVTSHFDLQLKDGGKDDKKNQKQPYQEQSPPFRDSQQTSIFYHTINIVNDVKNPEIPSPQIFEIGRNGYVRLGVASSEQSIPKFIPQILPWDESKLRLWLLDQTNLLLLLLAGIIFSLIFFHWRILPDSGKRSIYLSCVTLIIFLIALFAAKDESGEPLRFTDGVSLWPTIFIQLIAISLAGYFFWRGRKDLDVNFRELNEQYLERYFQIPLPESGWRLVTLSKLPGIILMLSIPFYALNDAYPSSVPFIWCLGALLLLAIFYLPNVERGEDGFNFNSVKDWIDNDNRRVRNANGLWEEYYNYGLLQHRLSRVVTIWLIFAIIETVLIYLLPPWPLPCRGITCHWVYWTGVMSFIVVMILLFCILDAVRLNFYWIRKLRMKHPLLVYRITERDPNVINAFNGAIRRNAPLQSLENIIAIVAERTEVVDKLIYYPMLCIMLMLFARITYFDNQDFPLSKGVTFAVSISLLFFSGFMLRDEASKLKRSIIESVEYLGRNNGLAQVDIAELDRTKKRINDICEGAFESMFEQPVLRALLIILASIGLFTGEYLKLFE